MSADKRNKLAPPKASARRRSVEEAFIPKDIKPEPEPEQMFTVKMPRELHRRAKLQALKEDRTMKDIVVGLLRDYLDEQEK